MFSDSSKTKKLFFIATFFTSVSVFGSQSFFFSQNFQKNAHVRDTSLYAESEKGFENFWGQCAQELDWFKKWDQVLAGEPPYVKWFPEGTLNVSYNCLDRHVLSGNGEKIALIYLNERGQKSQITYTQLLDEVNRVSNLLKKLGVERGDKVAIYMPMVPESIASMLACTRIGAVHLVIFGGMGPQAVKERIFESQAKVLLTADGCFRAGRIVAYKSHLDPVLEECPSLEKVIVLQHTNSPVVIKEGRDYWYQEEIANCSSVCPPEEMSAEDPLFILYTSGTTGKPKGILHTTGGYLVAAHNTFKWIFDIKREDIYWSTADIGWITGHSYVVYGPLSNCATQLIYEGSFDYPAKNQLARVVDECGVSILYTAPTLVRMLMKWGDEALIDTKLNTLRLLGSVGEPINPETWSWYYKNIGHEKCPIVDTWFQTETGCVVIAPLPGVTPLLPGTATKALPGYSVGVLDEEGNPCSKGYLAILRPFPSMMRGIYNDPQRYESTYWNQWQGKYYFTGDFASTDENGYFWLGGRCDEVLKVAGHRIGTAEIENALIQNTAVAESAVCGIYDSIRGEKIIAFVVLKDGVNAENIEKQLRQSVVDYVGSYAAPSKIVLVDNLPKTKSGKILRRVLKNLLEGKEIGNISTLNDPSCIEELTQICNKLNQEQYLQDKLPILPKDPECAFRKATPTDELTWSIFKKSFKETIGPIYGPQESALQKLELGIDREGFVMYASGRPVGVIAYKTQLSHELADVGYDNSLEIKSLFVIDAASNSGKGYGSYLLDRINSVAQKIHAQSLHVTVSAKVHESLTFFQRKKFVVVKIDKNHHETGDVEYTLARKISSGD